MNNVIPLHPVLPRTLSRDEAKALVREVLEDSARLIWTGHVQERMDERHVTDMQVLQVLRRGQVTQDPVFGDDRNWEIRMEADTAGDRVRVGAAVDVDKMGFMVLVITVVVL
ncbi:DUF4258 domain-containing protein [Dyella sp.]|uniref:DUF4258 domain-containing protein n=1 Tax=Dyella sp. TaxID=1869338 RepID=UPI002B48A0F2|nr:DUF4258 domain-containing protein [Dyella sp.]HKT30695.1 DUF4258 domain-containing protein [Dyella sp.]